MFDDICLFTFIIFNFFKDIHMNDNTVNTLSVSQAVFMVWVILRVISVAVARLLGDPGCEEGRGVLHHIKLVQVQAGVGHRVQGHDAGVILLLVLLVPDDLGHHPVLPGPG